MNVDDIRRRAPLHFWAKADNARYCAWTFWNEMEGERHADPGRIGYRGNPVIALTEGWRRERSLALECVLKAVIAQREEGSVEPRVVRATHNVSLLWDEAGLGPVGTDDRIRLLETWQILQWAGRYAAPNAGSDGQRSDLSRMRKQKGTLLSRHPPFGWVEFDGLYQRAAIAFYEAHAALYGEE